MRINVKQGSLTEEPCDVLIVNLFEGVKLPGGGTGAVDKALNCAISDVIREEDFKGCLGDLTILRVCGEIPAKKVLLVGLGKREELNVINIMRASACAARKCRSLRAGKVASILHGAGHTDIPVYDCARATALGAILGTYEFTRLKTEDNQDNPIEEFNIVEFMPEKIPSIRDGIERAEVIGEAVTFARDLINEPSNVVTPSYLAELAQSIASENDLYVNVLDREGIEKAGMGLMSAVARGTAVEPRFIEIKYQSPNAKKTISIIGKGITFDSGGYSLKSSEAMSAMKDDMSGAAAVLGAIRAIARLKPDINVTALIPATENMIGGKAIHPGDVFKSLAGYTVEVNNTDAEGRLILADAIAYAKNQEVDEIIDLATLTGSCVIALGRQLSGIFGNNQPLIDSLISCGSACGEELWQLPLYKDYREELKSEVADIKNVGGREAGAIIGALFIEKFVSETPWAHIDLASASVEKDTHLAKKGGTGVGTGTLIEYILSQ